MKKVLEPSILVAEIAAFAMLLLLFFLNTDKPYLLLVPIAGVISGYFLFKRLIRVWKAVPLLTVFSILLGALISASVIGLLYILR
ncbi:MAG: hypothetical protein LBH95_07500 [Oscillospiraceae bacterium]|jgi:hypothetical protein|nr:hypothetical protein [Oscillospiraceae bacterium]